MKSQGEEVGRRARGPDLLSPPHPPGRGEKRGVGGWGRQAGRKPGGGGVHELPARQGLSAQNPGASGRRPARGLTETQGGDALACVSSPGDSN